MGLPPKLDYPVTTFKQFDYGSQLQDNLENYKLAQETEKTDQEAFRAAVADVKKRGVSCKSPYTLSLLGQVTALTRWHFQLRIHDRFQLCASNGLSWTVAIVIDIASYTLPLTSAGTSGRKEVSSSSQCNALELLRRVQRAIGANVGPPNPAQADHVRVLQAKCNRTREHRCGFPVQREPYPGAQHLRVLHAAPNLERGRVLHVPIVH